MPTRAAIIDDDQTVSSSWRPSPLQDEDPVRRPVMEVSVAGAVVLLRALARGDEAQLLRIHRTPEVVRWWDSPHEGFPWDEPQSARFTIEVDHAIAGLIQFSEEPEPKYRHAGIDLFLDPALHCRGYGTAAVSRLARHLLEDCGHHRITIDPAVQNAAAIRAYEKAGFRAVGVMRQAERDVAGDGWHDSLLMELLADERPRG